LQQRLWGWYLAWGDAVRVYGPARLAEAVDGEAVKVIRSLLAVVLSLVAFVVVYLFAYLVTAAEGLRIRRATSLLSPGYYYLLKSPSYDLSPI
jgi:hypothetical protein